MKNLKPSQFGKLNKLDAIKAVVMTAFVAIIAIAMQLYSGNTIDWKPIFDTILSTLLAYLSKNLIENENGTFGKVKVNK